MNNVVRFRPRIVTCQDAEAYIRMGIFPENRMNGVVEVIQLQDAFGNLPHSFIDSVLLDEELGENAERLFRLLWPTDIKHYLARANAIKELRDKWDALSAEMQKIEQALALI